MATTAITPTSTRPELWHELLIFSTGQASPLLYALYKAAGAIGDDELLSLRQFGSRLEGHPSPVLPWVDVATGSLCFGLPVGAGIALAAKTIDPRPYRVGCWPGTARWPKGPSGRRLSTQPTGAWATAELAPSSMGGWEKRSRTVERAALSLGDLALAGLDLKQLTDELEQDGIAQFGRSLDVLETRIGSSQPQAKAA